MNQPINQLFQNYISRIAGKYSNKRTSEYGYRTDFENLLSEIFHKINVREIEHDSKTKEGNKPDFIITSDSVPLLYIETKDIGADLDKIEKSGQMARYYGYANLVLTDYLEFRFYRNGERYQEPIFIGKYDKNGRSIEAIQQNFELLSQTIIDFAQSHKEPIKSGLHLSKIMGGKAQRIRENIKQILEQVDNSSEELKKVYETIKRLLIHDLKPVDFADMYAQTLVYGLFVARYHDTSSESFSRAEARDLIPASNPFLRHFFDHIAGPNFNKRLEYIVDELCEVFTHADVEKLMDDYYRKEKQGENQKGPDPVIHFYEDFLKEYDPALRKRMGAYYTPQPVVQFIVRAVDDILKRDFGLKDGLADTSKDENAVHKVQVLDPAVGTGTFFSAVIGHIYKGIKDKKQEGRWPKYVHNDLLPRIHGFELMMAPYTIAHLKLSMAFKKTGFKYFNDRLGIYLTNSLEDLEIQQDMYAFGFAESIAKESEEAAKIKSETPVMVVIGNPPYSGESSNKGNWIMNLMEDYKKEPGSMEKLKERNPKWINDDYVKFIRFGQHFIEKNVTGIVAFITPHGFLDNPTFRGMRWNLLKTYDKIYVLNLHGNAKKKEVAPDGSKDENVFDIQQGVCINIFVRTSGNTNEELGKIFYKDLWGKRKDKFDFLGQEAISSISFNEVPAVWPMYFMVPKNFELESEYSQGFNVSDLFPAHSLGILTKRDRLSISHTIHDLELNISRFLDPQNDLTSICLEFNLPIKDNDNWDAAAARDKGKHYESDLARKLTYRPFDDRYVYYSKDFVARTNEKIFLNLKHGNIALIVGRQGQVTGEREWNLLYVANKISDQNIFYRGGGSVFPLYLYSDGTKTANFDPEITDKITSTIGEFQPEDLFDYIYAVLHSPTYRERYKEFLKIDFPRVPYPKDRNNFGKLAKIGAELRELHLMESEKVQSASLPYPEVGDDTVEKITYKDGNVYINETQYFGEVPELAWNFYIGGYQPAQKWLKDRKGRTLSNEDIEHYQGIIFVLIETDRLMREVDKLVIF